MAAAGDIPSLKPFCGGGPRLPVFACFVDCSAVHGYGSIVVLLLSSLFVCDMDCA